MQTDKENDGFRLFYYYILKKHDFFLMKSCKEETFIPVFILEAKVGFRIPFAKTLPRVSDLLSRWVPSS